MKNHKNTNRRMVADGIVALLEIGFLIASWVWVFLNPEDILIKATAYFATLIVLITLWAMTLSSKIRRLREDSEALRGAIQSIQTNLNTTNESLNTLSVLLADTVSLQRQGVENQRKFNELMLEDIELTAENIILRLQTQKFEAVLKKHAPTSTDDERQEP